MRKAQSIVEYVVTLTVIIAAILAASSYLKNKVGTGMKNAADLVVDQLNTKP
jgi:hypothetical protein